MTTESKYKPIWEALKTKQECKVTAPPEFHKMIIKAVKKRKNNDVVFKLFLAEQYKDARLFVYKKGTIITFRLRIDISIKIGVLHDRI